MGAENLMMLGNLIAKASYNPDKYARKYDPATGMFTDASGKTYDTPNATPGLGYRIFDQEQVQPLLAQNESWRMRPAMADQQYGIKRAQSDKDFATDHTGIYTSPDDYYHGTLGNTPVNREQQLTALDWIKRGGVDSTNTKRQAADAEGTARSNFSAKEATIGLAKNLPKSNVDTALSNAAATQLNNSTIAELNPYTKAATKAESQYAAANFGNKLANSSAVAEQERLATQNLIANSRYESDHKAEEFKLKDLQTRLQTLMASDAIKLNPNQFRVQQAELVNQIEASRTKLAQLQGINKDLESVSRTAANNQMMAEFDSRVSGGMPSYATSNIISRIVNGKLVTEVNPLPSKSFTELERSGFAEKDKSTTFIDKKTGQPVQAPQVSKPALMTQSLGGNTAAPLIGATDTSPTRTSPTVNPTIGQVKPMTTAVPVRTGSITGMPEIDKLLEDPSISERNTTASVRSNDPKRKSEKKEIEQKKAADLKKQELENKDRYATEWGVKRLGKERAELLNEIEKLKQIAELRIGSSSTDSSNELKARASSINNRLNKINELLGEHYGN